MLRLTYGDVEALPNPASICGSFLTVFVASLQRGFLGQKGL